jgi:hypothetical protein
VLLRVVSKTSVRTSGIAVIGDWYRRLIIPPVGAISGTKHLNTFTDSFSNYDSVHGVRTGIQFYDRGLEGARKHMDE